MVNHQAVRHHPSQAVAINGHEPMIFYNLSTGHANIHCDTCGWIARGFRRRWHAKVEEEWRLHAGDVAMGVQIKHGTVGNGCHCASCAWATRAGAE